MATSTPPNICAPLSSSITNRVTLLESRNQYILKFLNEMLPPSDVKGIESELKKTFLLDKHRSKTKKSKQKKTPFLTSRKRVLLSLNKYGTKKDILYSEVIALNSMWIEYMHQVLGVEDFANLPRNPNESNWENIGQRLTKADYHGAEISVVKAKCSSMVGIRGIILQDTKNTFRLISKDNIVRTIPKETSVFRIDLEDTSFEVYGRELCIRPAERSVKKFKNTHIPML